MCSVVGGGFRWGSSEYIGKWWEMRLEGDFEVRFIWVSK